MLHYQNLGYISLVRKSTGEDINLDDYFFRNERLCCTVFLKLAENEKLILVSSEGSHYELIVSMLRHIEKSQFYYEMEIVDKNSSIETILKKDLEEGFALRQITPQHLPKFLLLDHEGKEVWISNELCTFTVYPDQIKWYGIYYFTVGKKFKYAGHQNINLVVEKKRQCSQNEFEITLKSLSPNTNLVKSIQSDYKLDYRSLEEKENAILTEKTNKDNAEEKVSILSAKNTAATNLEAANIMMEFLGYDFKTALNRLDLKHKFYLDNRYSLEIGDVKIIYKFDDRIAPALDYPYTEINREIYCKNTIVGSFSKSWSEDEDFRNRITFIEEDLETISAALQELVWPVI